jgi:hypothetical protein
LRDTNGSYAKPLPYGFIMIYVIHGPFPKPSSSLGTLPFAIILAQTG